MAKGIGNGAKQAPSIWGPLSQKEIEEAEDAAIQRARATGRRDVEMFADLTPAERQDARKRALLNEH